MLINEAGVVRAIKRAYKGGGYTVSVKDGIMSIYTPSWYVQARREVMPRKVLAAIVEHAGMIPGENEPTNIMKDLEPQLVILINSALVSAQSRQRLYWTNIPGVEQPEDLGILLRDILEIAVCEKGYTLKTPGKPLTEREMEYMVRETSGGRNHFDFDYHHDGTKEKGACVTANTHRGVPYNVLLEPVRIGTIESATESKNFNSGPYRVYSPDGKSVTLSSTDGGTGSTTGLYAVPAGMEWRGRGESSSYEIRDDQKANSVTAAGHQSRLVIEAADGKTYPVYEVRDGQITIKGKQYPIKLADGFYIIRKLTVTECKRLQTVPEEYIFPVSDTQAYKMLGNGWTVDVIAHILHYAPGITEEPLEVLSMYDGMSCGHLALDKLGAHIAHYYARERA